MAAATTNGDVKDFEVDPRVRIGPGRANARGRRTVEEAIWSMQEFHSVPAAAQTGRGRAGELPICGESVAPSFGCGRPQCGDGVYARLE